MQRYQDLIEHYLTREINGLYGQLNAADSLEAVEAWMATGTPVLNALNTRYVVLDGNYPPLVNDAALGAAWFVDSVALASTPDEEIALLGAVDLRSQAVVTTPVDPVIPSEASVSPSIRLTSYAPNELHYQYSTPTDRLAVFSEIYYPNGWHATVDGEPLELIRANWTLRAALLPAGSPGQLDPSRRPSPGRLPRGGDDLPPGQLPHRRHRLPRGLPDAPAAPHAGHRPAPCPPQGRSGHRLSQRGVIANRLIIRGYTLAATRPARSRKAWESGRLSRATGSPVSAPSRISCTRGIWPRKGMSRLWAIWLPPSLPKR